MIFQSARKAHFCIVLIALASLCEMQSSAAQAGGGSLANPDGGNSAVTGREGYDPVWTAMQRASARVASQIGRVDSPLGQRLTLPPFRGEEGYTDATKQGNEFGEAKTYGPNVENQYQLLFPPLTELQRMTDSQTLLEMSKQLINKKIAVMGQTFYMVENGAATGYFQGLNLVSNTLSNIMQTNDFQLKVMDLTDPSGQMHTAWISDVFKKTQEDKKGWAASLMSAQGDTAKFFDEQQKSGGEFNELKREPFNFKKIIDSSSSDINGFETNRDGKTIRLSTLVFSAGNKGSQDGPTGAASNGSNGKFDNENMPALKSTFTSYFGDYVIEFAQGDSETSAREIKLTRIPPRKDPNTAGNRTGLARSQFEEASVVWENFHKVLKSTCEWKKQLSNQSGLGGQGAGGANKIGKMETISTFTSMDKKAWELASAPDIPMSTDVLQMVFKLFEKGQRPSELDCNALNVSNATMPPKYEDPQPDKLDDCGQQGEKGCLRNRIVLHLAYVIGRSRALHNFLILQNMAFRFATSPAQRMLLERIMEDVYGNTDLVAELKENKKRHEEFVNFFGSETQNDIGGSHIFGDGANNVPKQGQGF